MSSDDLVADPTHLAVDLERIKEEYLHARQRFAPMHSGHEGWAVIKEELDELWELVRANKGDSLEAYEEAMQVAAMALAYMMEVAP